VARRLTRSGLNATALALVLLATAAGPAVAAPGDLDTSFGAPNGFVLTSVSGGNVNGGGVLVDPAGRIVVRASEFVSSNQLLGLIRYLPGGALDPAFGGGSGMVFKSFTGMTGSLALAMVRQPDGAVVLGGYADNGTDKKFGVARFTDAGALDTSFNPTGTPPGTRVTDLLSSTDERITGLGLLSSGKIAAIGSAQGGALEYLRYTTDGAVDLDPVASTFTGVTSISPTSMVVEAGDKILVGGSARVGATDQLFLARLKDDGTPDTAFGTGGITTFNVGSPTGDDRSQAIALQPDGSVVIAGTSDVNLVDNQFAVARLTPSGSLDPSFGSGGIVLLSPSPDRDIANAVALQPNGKLLIGGEANVVGEGSGDFAVVRLNTNGALDPTFGNGGAAVHSLIPGGDIAAAIALQGDGNIVAAGSGFPGTAGDVAVARFLGGEVSPPPPPAARDTTKPKISRLKLLNTHLRAIRRAKALKVRLHLSEAGSVTVKVTISVRRRHHRRRAVTLAHRTVRFTKAGTKTFQIKLGRGARSRLNKLSKPKIKLVASAKDLAGNRAKQRTLSAKLKRH
jgi:uncharacterized delta-60 repeat protein